MEIRGARRHQGLQSVGRNDAVTGWLSLADA